MNYLREINAFVDWLETNPLDAITQALWFHLMTINYKCNSQGWFAVANLTLRAKLGVDKKTIIKHRNILIQKQLIEYKNQGKTAGRYKMVPVSARMEGINPQEQGPREDGKDNPTYPAPTEKAVGNSSRFQTQEENTGINNHAFQEPEQNTRQNSFSLRASGQMAGESNPAFQVDGGGAGGSNPPAWEPYKNNGEINPPGPELTGVIPKEVHPAGASGPDECPPTGGNTPLIPGPTGEMGGNAPPIRGAIENAGGNIPPTRGPTQNIGGNIPPIQGPTGDIGGNNPPIRGLTEDTGGNNPPIREPIEDMGGNIPPIQGPTGDTGGNIPPIRPPIREPIQARIRAPNRSAPAKSGPAKPNEKEPNQAIYINKYIAKDKKYINKYIYTIFEHWNAQQIITHRKLSDRQKGQIQARLAEGYTMGEILEAITNYAEVVRGEEHYWTHKWRLDEFLARGLDKFKSESDPKTNFLKDKTKAPNRAQGGANKYAGYVNRTIGYDDL